MQLCKVLLLTELACISPSPPPHTHTRALTHSHIRTHTHTVTHTPPLANTQVKQHCGLDLATDPELLREVHTHPRITYEGARWAGATPPTQVAAWYAYKPEIEGVYDRITMLNYVRDLKGRAALADSLRKCYMAAADDLLSLQKDNKVFIIGHPEPGMVRGSGCARLHACLRLFG